MQSGENPQGNNEQKPKAVTEEAFWGGVNYDPFLNAPAYLAENKTEFLGVILGRRMQAIRDGKIIVPVLTVIEDVTGKKYSLIVDYDFRTDFQNEFKKQNIGFSDLNGMHLSLQVYDKKYMGTNDRTGKPQEKTIPAWKLIELASKKPAKKV